MNFKIQSIVCYLSIFVCAIASAAQIASSIHANQENQSSAIEYVVDLTDAKNHYVSVTMTVPARGDTTDLMMAVWTPGSYLVREYSRHIDSLRVTNKEGQNLPFEKTRKNRWQVNNQGAGQLVVKYRLYANELTVRTNWVGRQYAMLNGAATFLTVPERIENPHQLRLVLPRGWTRSATSMKAKGDVPNAFVAGSYHELVDSPIVAGNVTAYPFQAGSVTHQLVNVGESGFWDGTRAATDLSKLVAEHHKLWGVIPYTRFLFLNVICQRGGGLEHDNSTLIMTSRWSYRDEKRYKDWLSLASHEFFHTWNVRRLRPKSLVKYDYENESYTPSLWIAEGITSYYEDILLVRAGLIDRKEYLGRLSQNIGRVQRSAGRLVQSLSESSYDSWIKLYRPNENSSNTSISYYSKGAVVAFLLDAKIRGVTGGANSLDDVMREMYKRFSGDRGYAPDDFRIVASEVAGTDLSRWFATAVDSAEELDYRGSLDWFGLSLSGYSDESKPATSESSNGDDSNLANKSVAEVTADAGSKENAWLGFRIQDDGVITRVTANSPATEAGINTNDELIAINGFRFSGNLETRLKQYQIGDKLELLLSRRGQIIELPIKIGSVTERSWKLKFKSDSTDEQKKRVDDWLD